MPNVFRTIPDWFSFENQGAGIVCADLSNDGSQDLIVLMVDNPGGQNRGLYRVGKRLDAIGNVTGGWTPWIDVPDWFSFDNQGAGIAVGDLDRDGRLDLVVLMVDNPAGQNRGVYRVGKKLDANGNVTGGWGPWIDVPDWFSFENQGAGIALSPPDALGNRDLIVFMIDNPPQQNQGFYRIARNLDGDGAAIGGWTPWRQVPERDWFSWENQGAGVAVIDREGRRDIIIFQIDAPPTQNQAFFKIGRGMAADGTVTERDWSPWYGVPGWFSVENQGGGIAVADLAGNSAHDLVVLNVESDNPGGPNAGLYQIMALDNDPRTQGTWDLLPYLSEVLPVHAALLPGGKVLFAAGSGNSSVRFNDKDFGDVSKKIFCSVVWDYVGSTPAQPKFIHPQTLRNPDGRVLDFFCCGQAFLADGRLLTAGGTLAYDVDPQDRPTQTGFEGRLETMAFDPATREWARMADMADGRWYPTLVTLGDGRVLVVAGVGRHGEANRLMEVFTPNAGAGSWTQLPLPPPNVFSQLPLYAHLFLMANGLIFFTGGRMDDADSSLLPCLLDITRNAIQVRPILGLQQVNSRNQSASVLLPPVQEQRVMILGGATPAGEDNAIDSVDIVDLKTLTNPLPTYQPAARMLLPRVHLNAVLLPDRTVFVCGGALQREGGTARKITARYQSEIYDPLDNTWRLAATAQVARMYHSVALLLPDGRVVAASGNPDKGHQVVWEPPDPNEELHIEVYSPPYVQGPRPTIGTVPTEWRYGQTVIVPSPQAGNIRWVSLIMNGVTTHSFNTGQRLVDVEILSQGNGQLNVRMTADSNIAPPGWYMLFLTDNARVPSVAAAVHLT